jgi:hypothetical protein
MLLEEKKRQKRFKRLSPRNETFIRKVTCLSYDIQCVCDVCKLFADGQHRLTNERLTAVLEDTRINLGVCVFVFIFYSIRPKSCSYRKTT